MVIKEDNCLFMSRTIICVTHMDAFLFLTCFQCDIDKLFKSFKVYQPSCNWEHSKGDSVSGFLGIETKALNMVVFIFTKIDWFENYWKLHVWSI